MVLVMAAAVHGGNEEGAMTAGADHEINEKKKEDVKQEQTVGSLFPGRGSTGPGIGIVIQPGTGGGNLPPFRIRPPGEDGFGHRNGGIGPGNGGLGGRPRPGSGGVTGPGLGRFRHRYGRGNGPRFGGGNGPGLGGGGHGTGPGSGYEVGAPGGYDYDPDYGSPGGSDYEPGDGSPDPGYGGPGDGFSGGDDPGYNGGGFGPGFGGIGSSHGRGNGGGYVPP